MMTIVLSALTVVARHPKTITTHLLKATMHPDPIMAEVRLDQSTWPILVTIMHDQRPR